MNLNVAARITTAVIPIVCCLSFRLFPFSWTPSANWCDQCFCRLIGSGLFLIDFDWIDGVWTVNWIQFNSPAERLKLLFHSLELGSLESDGCYLGRQLAAVGSENDAYFWLICGNRPHFIDACQPKDLETLCSGTMLHQYITNYTCTTSDLHRIKDSRSVIINDINVICSIAPPLHRSTAPSLHRDSFHNLLDRSSDPTATRLVSPPRILKESLEPDAEQNHWWRWLESSWLVAFELIGCFCFWRCRLSFPSGHASFSAYTMLYLALYLQVWTTNININIYIYIWLYSPVYYAINLNWWCNRPMGNFQRSYMLCKFYGGIIWWMGSGRRMSWIRFKFALCWLKLDLVSSVGAESLIRFVDNAEWFDWRLWIPPLNGAVIEAIYLSAMLMWRGIVPDAMASRAAPLNDVVNLSYYVWAAVGAEWIRQQLSPVSIYIYIFFFKNIYSGSVCVCVCVCMRVWVIKVLLVLMWLELQARMTWSGSYMLRPLLQTGALMLSWLTGLSRVSDYKHHW